MTARRALFLDRDGTIIFERNYLADPRQVELIPGVADALRTFRKRGYALVVISNQSGIARGYYTHRDFEAVQKRLEELLLGEDIVLDGVFYCPHHPDITGPCDCRKPGLALYREAAARLGLDLGRSLYVGDRGHDAAPALQLGGRGYIVATGQTAQPGEEALEGVQRAANLAEIATRETVFPD